MSDSPAAVLVDEDGNPVAIHAEAGTHLSTHDEQVTMLLKEVVHELQKIRSHLQLITEVEITDEL